MAIRIRTVDRCLIISDDPALFWLFYGMFVLGGATALYLSLTHATSTGMTVAGSLIGLGNIAGGLYMIRREPASRVEIDAEAKAIRVTRWGIGGRRNLTLALLEFTGADVETTEHTDGGLAYRPRMRLTASREVPVSLFWYQTVGPSRSAAEHIERFIRDAGSVT